MSGAGWKALGVGATIGRGPYFTIGFVLTLIKFGIDRFVAGYCFDRSWSPWSYALTGEIGGLFSLDREDQVFYATMLAFALPFVVIGVVLTVRRLRDVGWPLWLVALFFAPPPINLVFFIALSLMPGESEAIDGTLRDEIDGPPTPRSRPPASGGRFSFGRALAAIVIPLVLVIPVIYLGTHVLRDYGWSLFVGIPFVLPMVSVLIYGHGRAVTIEQCLQLGVLWMILSTCLLIVTAFEGLICIIMLLPLAAPIVIAGLMVGYFIVGHSGTMPHKVGKFIIVFLAVLPMMIGAEHLTRPEPLRFTCRTSVVIDAPPETVWQYVVSFSDLDPPTDWIFRTGLAYPIRARIDGKGVGAVRRCEFSTGAFVEPITAWDEPRRLQFGVTSNPAPMKEWNPLFDIHPPHLDGFLVARKGQFLLTPLPGGKTLLEGQTLYQHGLWPASYWRLWSDPIIHRIHDRVLKHIKKLAEATPQDRA
jgi:hypothetical protein